MKEKITPSCGNIFVDFGCPPDEVAILTMRSELMGNLHKAIEKRGWTQAEAT